MKTLENFIQNNIDKHIELWDGKDFNSIYGWSYPVEYNKNVWYELKDDESCDDVFEYLIEKYGFSVAKEYKDKWKGRNIVGVVLNQTYEIIAISLEDEFCE